MQIESGTWYKTKGKRYVYIWSFSDLERDYVYGSVFDCRLKTFITGHLKWDKTGRCLSGEGSRFDLKGPSRGPKKAKSDILGEKSRDSLYRRLQNIYGRPNG